MKKTIFLGVVLCAFVWAGARQAQAQILKNLFKNKLAAEINNEGIALNQTDTTIVVPYTLKGYRNRLYMVKLSYSNNSGTSYKGPLRSVIGDVGDSIRVGAGKSIAWKFRRDNPYFDGKNISFKLEVTEKPKIALGGAKYALRSLLMPGLGDTKVRNGYRYGWIAVGTYACLATGAFFTYKAHETYQKHTSRFADDAQAHFDYYRISRNYKTAATVFFATGASVWLGDVIGVYFRGLKNRRQVARERKNLEAEKENKTSMQILPYSDGQSGNVAFIWKF